MGGALATVVLAVALVACAGESTFDQCVEHSVEEGVDRAVAERACESAVGR